MPKRRPDHVPQRTCAVCGTVHPKRDMTRVVRGLDGSVSMDPTGRMPGRGTYVCADAACADPDRRARAIQRALGSAPVADVVSEVGRASA